MLIFFFDLHRQYNSCLIPFLSSRELFPAFICAKSIGNRASICCGVSIFNPDPDISFFKAFLLLPCLLRPLGL